VSDPKPWLERDPQNGCLIGPDGCHYANEHQAMHFAVLGLCGCGDTTGAYNFCRSVIACFDRRGVHDNPPTRQWISAEAAIAEIIKADPEMAAHVIAHLLDRNKLLEHGGVISGSWLAENGIRLVDMPPATDEIMDEER
jgi:hypothetical protein